MLSRLGLILTAIIPPRNRWSVLTEMLSVADRDAAAAAAQCLL